MGYGFCESALPDNFRVVAFVRPSFKAFEALVATAAEVCFPVPDCASTLAAIDFCVALDPELDSDREAVEATPLEVWPDLAIE